MCYSLKNSMETGRRAEKDEPAQQAQAQVKKPAEPPARPAAPQPKVDRKEMVDA